jgi:Kef-type K+ transport system membrane component KefB
MATLLPILALVLIGGRFAARLATRFGLPGLFGELVLGLVLGPFIVRWMGDTTSTFSMLGDLGVLLMMLLVGLETDLGSFRWVGIPAFLIACVGALTPFGAGAFVASRLGFSTETALVVGVAFSATSVSITAATLREMDKLQSRSGSTILLAAVIDDVVGLLLLAFVTAQHGGQPPEVALVRVGAVAVVTVVCALLLKPILHRIESHVEGFLALAVGLGFLFAWGTEVFGGLAPITGAYIAGLLLAHAVPHKPIVQGVEALATGFFATIFFVSLGLHVNLGSVSLPMVGLFLTLAIVTKVVGCGVAAKVNLLGWGESLAIGVGMIPRGEVALIVASLGLQQGLLNGGVFSALVLMAAGTTVITPVLLRAVFAVAEPRAKATREARLEQVESALHGIESALAAPMQLGELGEAEY